MKLHRIILEAEQNVAKKKIDQYLSQLSDIDLVSLLPTLKESLSESAQDMMQQKREGRRIDGLPSDFVAYDDATKTAKRFKEEPNGLEITDVQYSPAGQSNQTSAPEVKQIVNNLEKSEVEALADAVANELDKRKTGEKQSSNTKSNPALLKKVLTALLAGGLLAGAYGLGTVSSNDSSLEKIDQLQSTIQQYEQSDLPNADAKIKELTSQIQTIQSTLDTTQSTLDTTSAKYDQEKTEWNKSDQDKLAKIDQLQAKIQQYEQSDLPNANAKIKELTSQIQTIQSTLDTTIRDKSELERQEQERQEQEKQEQEKQDAEQEELELQKNTLSFIGGIQPGMTPDQVVDTNPKLKFDEKDRFKKGKNVRPGTRGGTWGAGTGGTIQNIIGNVGGFDTRNIKVDGKDIPGPYGAKKAYTAISFDNEDKADAQIFVIDKDDLPKEWIDDSIQKGVGVQMLDLGQLKRMTKRAIVNAPKELGSPMGDPVFVAGQQRGKMNLGLSTGTLVGDNIGLGLGTSLFNPSSGNYSVTQDFQHGRIIITGNAVDGVPFVGNRTVYNLYDIGMIIKLPDENAINFEESAALNDMKLLAGLN